MTASRSYPIPNSFSDAHVTPERYEALYQQSLEDPTVFWSEQATLLDWHTPWNEVSNTDISTGTAHWFVGARLNVSVNCIDRHMFGYEIERHLKKWPDVYSQCKGIVTIDTIPQSLKRQEFLIVNLSPLRSRGSHWVVIFKNLDSNYYVFGLLLLRCLM